MLFTAPLGTLKLADAAIALAGVIGTDPVAAVEKTEAEGERENAKAMEAKRGLNVMVWFSPMLSPEDHRLD